MDGIVYRYHHHSVLHFPIFSSFNNKNPKLGGRPIFSLRDIADVCTPCEKKELKLSVSCIGGDRRGQAPRRSSGNNESERTGKKSEESKKQSRGDGRKSKKKTGNQEEIISLFRRIQSSISKDVKSVYNSKKIEAGASSSQERPPSAESILRVLQGGPANKRQGNARKLEGEKVEKEQLIQGNALATDVKLMRPPSKFVKRSPIPSPSTPTQKLVKMSNGASSPTEVTEELESESERVEEMKLPELKELAKSRGVRGYSKLKKKELLELLKS